MYKVNFIVVILFAIFACNQIKASGHQETIYAERIIGRLAKCEMVDGADIDSLLEEASKSERGSSLSTDVDNAWGEVEAETDSLFHKARSVFDEPAMKNLDDFLVKFVDAGKDRPAALAEALCVIRQLY